MGEGEDSAAVLEGEEEEGEGEGEEEREGEREDGRDQRRMVLSRPAVASRGAVR